MTRNIPIYAALLFLSHQALAASATASASATSTGGATLDLTVTGTGGTASGSATVTVNGVVHTVTHTQVGPGSFHGHAPAALSRDSRR